MGQKIKNYFLYFLVDPNTDQIKYVGKTVHPINRLSQHKLIANNPNCKKTLWVKSLNRTPYMIVFDVFQNKETALQAENFVMDYLKQKGYDLVNTNGFNMSIDNLTLFNETLKKCDLAEKICFPLIQEQEIIVCPWLDLQQVKAAKLHRIQVYVTSETKKLILKMAEKQDRSESYIASEMLNNYF